MSQKQQRKISILLTDRVRYIYFHIFSCEKLKRLNFQKANLGTHLPRCVPKALQSNLRDLNPIMKRFFHPAVSFQFLGTGPILCKSFWYCTAYASVQHLPIFQLTELKGLQR